MPFFALYTHLEVLIPMSAGQVFGANFAFLVFLVNSLTVIIFQVPLNSRLTSLNSTTVLSSSLLLMALGFGAMSAEQHLSLFLLGIFLFSLGEVIFTPRLESDFSETIPRNAVGRAMGVLGLAAGLGSSFGNLLGGRLFQSSATPGYYWQMVAVASLTMAILVFIMMKRCSGSLPPMRKQC